MLKRIIFLLTISACLVAAVAVFPQINKQPEEPHFVSYEINPSQQHLKLFWKDDQRQIFGSIQRLNSWLTSHKQQLLFAMNAGMYQQDQSPLGLYIEDGKQLRPLNTRRANGNFYLQPNGVFYLTNNEHAFICTTAAFRNSGAVKYATQSGPMLIIDSKINTVFTQDSKNLNIRNGVGILPGNKVVFAMSKVPVNFYEFAAYFKDLGCKNALYLDGFVSRTYLPEKNWAQTDGNFGVIVGVTADVK